MFVVVGDMETVECLVFLFKRDKALIVPWFDWRANMIMQSDDCAGQWGMSTDIFGSFYVTHGRHSTCPYCTCTINSFGYDILNSMACVFQHEVNTEVSNIRVSGASLLYWRDIIRSSSLQGRSITLSAVGP